MDDALAGIWHSNGASLQSFHDVNVVYIPDISINVTFFGFTHFLYRYKKFSSLYSYK